MSVTIEEIREAAERLKGQVVRTATVEAPRLSQALGCEVFVKLENNQFTGSFKDRGAYVKLVSLDEAQKAAGVIAMSAGNHAQGVAYHAQRLGIPATIVMPETAPFTKVERTRSFGARVVQAGDSLDEAAATARRLMEDEGLTFVHPFDDEKIIAGQGTIALELLEDRPDLDCLIVPIGGGGIISGMATAAKALKPGIEVYGVEAALYPSMYQMLRGLEPTSGGTSIADGIAVKSPGKLTREIIEKTVEDIFLVEEDALENAIFMLMEYQKFVAEGAGAAGLAALVQNRKRFAGRKVGLVLCGGNIDVRVLASLLMRGLVRDGRMIRLRIEINDNPGVLAKVSGTIGDAGGNILEVYHQRMFHDVPVRRADVDVVIETRNPDHVREIRTALEAKGFKTRLLSTISAEGTISV